jgi:hypothetical protein
VCDALARIFKLSVYEFFISTILRSSGFFMRPVVKLAWSLTLYAHKFFEGDDVLVLGCGKGFSRSAEDGLIVGAGGLVD